MLDESFLNASQVSQVIRSSEAVEIRHDDGVKTPFGGILEQRVLERTIELESLKLSGHGLDEPTANYWPFLTTGLTETFT